MEAPCAVCLDTPTDPVKLDCAHVLCRACLRTLEDRSQNGTLSQRCPTCRSPLPRVAAAYARGAAGVALAARAELSDERRREALGGAAVAFRSVVDVMPEHADAWHDLGVVLCRAGRPDPGERCLRRCAALSVGSRGAPGASAAVGERSRLALGRILAARGDVAEAAATFEACAALCERAGGTPHRSVGARASTALSALKLAAKDAAGALAAADRGVRLADAVDEKRAALAARGDAHAAGDGDGFSDYRAAAALTDDARLSDDEAYASSDDDDEPVAASKDDAETSLRLGAALARARDETSRALGRGLARAARRGGPNPTLEARAALQLGLMELTAARAGAGGAAAPRRAARNLARAAAPAGAAPPATAAIALARLGEARLLAGEPHRAVVALRRSLAIEPRRVAARLRLATALGLVADASAPGAAPFLRLEARAAKRAALAALSHSRDHRVVYSGELATTAEASDADRGPRPTDRALADAAPPPGKYGGFSASSSDSSDADEAAKPPPGKLGPPTGDRARRARVAAALAGSRPGAWAAIFAKAAEDGVS